MKKTNQVLALALACTMSACSTATKTSSENISTDNENIDGSYLIMSDEQRSTVGGYNEFALNLFRTQTGMDTKVFSPLSVSFLMGMLANGTDGNTLKEIINTIASNGGSLNDINETCRILLNGIAKEDKSCLVKIANAIVTNKNISLNKEYVANMDKWYDADITSQDFSSKKTVNNINKWCDKHTDGMIPQIINELDPSAVSVLLNAIYFNGTWETPFDAEETKLERFQGYTRDIKKVKTMHQEDEFPYAKKDNFAAVTMPYKGRKYAMTLLLPDNECSIEEMMKGFNSKEFDNLTSSMERCKVDLKLPKFSVETSLSLNSSLEKLGVKKMFAPGADFNKMSDNDVYVSQMLQKAKIEVTEEGTKAAAVTMAMVALTALQPEVKHVTFHANRPFVYIISDTTNGAIYFIGQFTGDQI